RAPAARRRAGAADRRGGPRRGDGRGRGLLSMGFNLSAWALRHRSLVLYAMLVAAVAGAYSYLGLGRSEDPEFTFKVMVIHALWPGADAAQVAEQVTEPIERKIMETGDYEFVRSYSRAGESQVIFAARDSMRSGEIPELNYQ